MPQHCDEVITAWNQTRCFLNTSELECWGAFTPRLVRTTGAKPPLDHVPAMLGPRWSQSISNWNMVQYHSSVRTVFWKFSDFRTNYRKLWQANVRTGRKKTVSGNEMNLFYFSLQWKLKVSYQSNCKHAIVRHMPIKNQSMSSLERRCPSR